MAEERTRAGWPDGISVSLEPSIPYIGMLGIGGTYYWNPGAADAPRLTVTGAASAGPEVMSFGPGLGLHGVFLRNGMTSKDTLGYGVAGNVSTILPSVTVNASVPDRNLIPQPQNANISSIEAGVRSSIGASVAPTYTWTPQQIADFLSKLLPPPGLREPDWRKTWVRDSVAAAGIPSRYNVFEFGFPDPNSAQPAISEPPPVRQLTRVKLPDSSGPAFANRDSAMPDANSATSNWPAPSPQMGPGAANRNSPSPNALNTGASPIQFFPEVAQTLPRGFPGWSSVTGLAPPASMQAEEPEQAGGLLGHLREYLRNNPH